MVLAHCLKTAPYICCASKSTSATLLTENAWSICEKRQQAGESTYELWTHTSADSYLVSTYALLKVHVLRCSTLTTDQSTWHGLLNKVRPCQIQFPGLHSRHPLALVRAFLKPDIRVPLAPCEGDRHAFAAAGAA